MNDEKLIELFFSRSEQALTETAAEYGRYALYIADNILEVREDSEEVVNDAYASLWDTIPPQRPRSLKAYLAKTVRNLALDRHRRNGAAKRGGGAVAQALDELKEAASPDSPENELDAKQLSGLINGFVETLAKKQRIVFVKRYWFLCSSEQIARECSMTVSDVNTTLFRTRQKLKSYLEQEGYGL